MERWNSRVETRLYEITADYRPKNPNKPKYYVIAQTPTNAKSLFVNTIPWLKIYSCTVITDPSRVNEVLANPRHYILLK